MPTEPRSPSELRDLLCRLFPAYRRHWEAGDNPFISDGGTFSYDGLMIAFCDYFSKNALSFSDKQLRDLAGLIDAAIVHDGSLDDAVSYCFLGHLHKIEGSKALTPFLSSTARERSDECAD